MPDSSITLSCAKIGSLKDSEMDEMSTDFGFPIDSDRDVFDSGDESEKKYIYFNCGLSGGLRKS